MEHAGQVLEDVALDEGPGGYECAEVGMEETYDGRAC